MVGDCEVVFGEGKDDFEVRSGEEMRERGVGSDMDMNDLGLSPGTSSFLVALIAVLFVIDGARLLDFPEDQGRGMVMVKLRL